MRNPAGFEFGRVLGEHVPPLDDALSADRGEFAGIGSTVLWAAEISVELEPPKRSSDDVAAFFFAQSVFLKTLASSA